MSAIRHIIFTETLSSTHKKSNNSSSNIPVLAVVFCATLDDMEGVNVTALVAPVSRRLVKDGSMDEDQGASLALCQLELLVGCLVLFLASECYSCRLGVANEPAVYGVLCSYL